MYQILRYCFSLTLLFLFMAPQLLEAQNRWGDEEALPYGVSAKLGGSKLNHGGTAIGGLGFSPTGQVISVAGDHNIRVWDKLSGDESFKLTGSVEKPFVIMSVSPDGQRAVVMAKGDTKPIEAWDITKKRRMAKFGEADASGNLPISPDGKYCLSFHGTSIKVYENVSGTLLKNFPSTKAKPKFALFMPGATTRFATLDEDGSHLRFYDWTSGREIYATKLKSNGKTLAFNPKGDKLYVVTEAGLIPYSTGALNRPGGRGSPAEGGLWSSIKEPINAVKVAADGKTIAISAKPAKIYLADALTGNINSTIETPGNETHLLFDPSGKYLISAGLGGGMRLWALGQKTRLVHKPKGHSGPITAAEFSSDKTLLLTSSVDGTARLWKTSNGEFVTSLAHGSPVFSAQFSEDNNSILTGAEDGVRLFKKSGELIWHFPIKNTTKVQAAFHKPDEIVAVSNNRIRMLDLQGKLTKMIRHSTSEVKGADGSTTTMQNAAPIIQGENFILSPAGNIVFVQNLGKSRTMIVEVATGKELFIDKNKAPANQAIAFAGNGQFYVEVLPDKFTVKDFKGRDRIGRPRGADEPPFYVGGLTYDGMTLSIGVTAGNTMWVWYLSQGQEGDELEGHRARITGIYYSKDGTKMASASSDGIVLIRDVD